jgi:hypothetical protein
MPTSFTLFCAVSVDALGSAIGESIGVSGISKPGVGITEITLENEAGFDELISNVNLRGNTAGMVTWRPNNLGTLLEVFTFDETGAPDDLDFDVICYRIVS